MTTTTKPLRVVWHVLFEPMRAEVASCQDCEFHHEDGTVTLCSVHASLTINDIFDRL